MAHIIDTCNGDAYQSHFIAGYFNFHLNEKRNTKKMNPVEGEKESNSQ